MTPPRPRLVLRVGVTGHRTGKLAGANPDALAEQASIVLQLARRTAGDAHTTARDAFAPEPPILRLVSPLAEGSDRIVAREALKLGYELVCPLPFPRDEYMKDFPDSAGEFQELLVQAKDVLELDGPTPSEERPEAYAAVGTMVLNQCDVLIAIWDEEPPLLRGGTAFVVAEALAREMPVVHIDSRAPHGIRLLATAERNRQAALPLDLLPARIIALLTPPPVEPREHEQQEDLREEYFRETNPKRGRRELAWRTVVRVFGTLSVRRKRSPGDDSSPWPEAWEAAPAFSPEVARHIDQPLQPHYSWTDQLAIRYAGLYRGTFVVNYGLGVVAVALAIAAGLAGSRDGLARTARAASFFVIALILFQTFWANRQQWHSRWTDYRLLSESLRQLRYLAPLGRVPPVSRVPAHAADGDPRTTWMAWYLRAVTREVGMVSAQFSQEYLESCRLLLRDGLVGAQRQYYNRTAARFELLEQNLRALQNAAFLVTLGLLVFFIAAPQKSEFAQVLEAALPALGTALAGLRSQGDLVKVSRRYRAMARQLGVVADELEAQPAPLSSTSLGRTAEHASDVMVAEVLDWRVLVQSHGLNYG